MATLTFQEERKRGYLALIAFVIIILLIFIVLHYGSPRKGESSPFIQPQPRFYLEEVEMNFDVFKNSFFESALPFEKIKPFEGPVGRENPFAPYPAVLPTSTATSTPTSSSATSGTPVISM